MLDSGMSEVSVGAKSDLPKCNGHFIDSTKDGEKAPVAAVKVATEANTDLSPATKELLCLYFKLGHICTQCIQWLV